MTRPCPTCGLPVHEGWKHIGCEDETMSMTPETDEQLNLEIVERQDGKVSIILTFKSWAGAEAFQRFLQSGEDSRNALREELAREDKRIDELEQALREANGG